MCIQKLRDIVSNILYTMANYTHTCVLYVCPYNKMQILMSAFSEHI